MSTESGVLREVWLAPASNPSDKSSFLIRDDAYAKRAAVYGKQVRLGEPTNVGIKSNWLQKTWQGGQAQDTWKDAEMFQSGQLDGTTKRGRLKLWPGFYDIASTGTTPVTGYMFANGVTGWGLDTPLWSVEMDRSLRGATTCRLYTTTLNLDGTRTTTLRQTLTSTATAIAPFGSDGAGHIAVGTLDGKFYTVRASDYATTLEADYTPGIGINSICGYNDGTYYAVGNQVWKRTATSTAFTHTLVKTINNAVFLSGFTVWNNRLWFMSYRAGGGTDVMVSDGATVTQAFTIPGECFPGHRLVAHYGSLYVLVGRQGSKWGSGLAGEVWRYTGGSLQLLYQSNPDQTATIDYIWDMASHGKWLAWTQNGFPARGRKPGVMYYDPELDAIFEGPTLDVDQSSPAVYTTALCPWNNTLAVSVWDSKNYNGSFNGPTSAFYIRTNGYQRTVLNTAYGGVSFGAPAATKSRTLASSLYDGEVSAEDKTWLRVKVRCKTPTTYDSIDVALILDETTTVNLGTITSASGTGWKEVALNAVSGGSHLRSKVVQYKLTLNQSDSGNDTSTTTPEVDYVAVEFVLSPSARRQWSLRAVCSDLQKRLDGTDNPLSSTSALRAKLEELWASGSPLLFWDAGTEGGTPGGDGTEVVATEWLDQPYRVDSRSTTINSEVSLTLAEIAA